MFNNRTAWIVGSTVTKAMRWHGDPVMVFFLLHHRHQCCISEALYKKTEAGFKMNTVTYLRFNHSDNILTRGCTTVENRLSLYRQPHPLPQQTVHMSCKRTRDSTQPSGGSNGLTHVVYRRFDPSSLEGTISLTRPQPCITSSVPVCVCIQRHCKVLLFLQFAASQNV